MPRGLFPIIILCAAAAVSAVRARGSGIAHGPETFKTSDQCMACHNGLKTSAGEDVSIGRTWRASMMANSARDPYWQAGVRREVIDHSRAAATVEDECATCHMPMSRAAARLNNGDGGVFAHLPVRNKAGQADRAAHDGVACALCHQITDGNFGSPASFSGGFVLAAPSAERPRAMFGPFKIERGLTTIMRSSTGFEPTEAPHVRQSELCATCHTLVTKARGPGGDVVGELPEQMPFLEWKHSALASEGRSCQSCHMPVIEEAIPIASVLGAPRQGVARHSFVGGNFFVQQMLNRYRDELGVVAPAAEMDEAARTTLRNLQQSTAAVAIERVAVADGRLVADVSVRNLTGHKFPTGYPSRRAWIHLVVRDGAGRSVFESGATNADGSIVGNANDRDPLLVEPHHSEIRSADDVQIYESIMEDARGRPTTGLLSAVRFLKDNRLLPAGFDKRTADAWIAVIGAARDDDDFNGAGDRVRYWIDVGRSTGPFQVDAEICFQVIGFRWAETLKQYKSEETARFVTFYESMAASSSVVVVSAQKRD